MGRIDIILPDDLEKQFRTTIFNRYGMKKGNITKAVEEAITSWIEENSVNE